MNTKEQLVKKNSSITCLTENALKQVSGGTGDKEKKIIEAVGTITGALVCGTNCAVVGHKIGSAAAEALKIFHKKKKRWHF
jgi:hypothetical protein